MKKFFAVAASATLLGAFAHADSYGLSISSGIFYPSNSLVKSAFGDQWWGFGISPASSRSATGGRIDYDVNVLTRSKNGNRVFIFAPTVGWNQGFGTDPRGTVPYFAARIGPAYTDFRLFGDTERGLIINTNFELGATVGERLRIFGRYDNFTKRAGVNFSGFSLNASWLFASF
ncbi:MAG: hypothetical protein JNK63_00530 [Chthonomonas sp.]|nr:hypothetical protein [Chthonomonas sp.]